MKTLKQYFQELDQMQWDYYNEYGGMHLSNPFISNETHKTFIEKFFNRSGKKGVLELKIEKNVNKNPNHSTAVFFLGILIYNYTGIKDCYYNKEIGIGYNEFPFLWFLACLYHDFGYGIESNSELLKKIYDFDDLKNEFSINNCLLKKKPLGVDNILFSNIRQYFYYRRFVDKRIDHGIIAGLFLFDRLVKNRMIKKTMYQQNSTSPWNKKLEKSYALVGAAIATHNIWMPTDKTICNYVKFEMKSLICKKPMKIKKFPLLYLLGIVDTIDPVKLYTPKYDLEYILSNLEIDFSENTIVIANGLSSELDFDRLIEKTDYFIGWLDIGIFKENNKLTLTIR
jgi:hypothetical protein